MHASRLPARPVKQPTLAPVADMSAVWQLAARLRLCHVPARWRQTTASSEPMTRSLTGIYIAAAVCTLILHLITAVQTR